MELSIVVPVYKEEGNIPEFLSRLRPILATVTDDYEVIFAMDPSPDGTEEVLRTAREQDPRIKMLKFSRRFGQPMATIAGMQYSTGEAVIVMDVDLQDPPELIPEMVRRWKAGHDVVFAQRTSRAGETALRRLVAYVGYKFINRIAEVSIQPNTGDFRLMSRRVVEQVLRLKESHGFLRGLVAFVGFNQVPITFDRPPRFTGQTKYNRFVGSLRIGFNGITCFSNYLLTLIAKLGMAIVLVSVLMAVTMAIWGTVGSVRAYASMLVTLFIGGVQLLSVGILGAYVGRIYDEVKRRPHYIVDRADGFGTSPNSGGGTCLTSDGRPSAMTAPHAPVAPVAAASLAAK
jgi:glycosyltransferase involved in cell wall biosynthesis